MRSDFDSGDAEVERGDSGIESTPEGYSTAIPPENRQMEEEAGERHSIAVLGRIATGRY